MNKMVYSRIYVWDYDEFNIYMFRFKCLDGDQVVTYTIDRGDLLEERTIEDMSVNFIRVATKQECRDYIQFEIEHGYFHELNSF